MAIFQYLVSIATVGVIFSLLCLGLNMRYGWSGDLDLAYYMFGAPGSVACQAAGRFYGFVPAAGNQAGSTQLPTVEGGQPQLAAVPGHVGMIPG